MSAARPDLAACAVLALALTCVVGKPSGPAKAPAAGASAAAPAAATRPARFAPPPGAVTNRAWLLRGAYEDGFFLRPSGWWARAADGGWIASLRVLSSGGAAVAHELSAGRDTRLARPTMEFPAEAQRRGDLSPPPCPPPWDASPVGRFR